MIVARDAARDPSTRAVRRRIGDFRETWGREPTPREVAAIVDDVQHHRTTCPA